MYQENPVQSSGPSSDRAPCEVAMSHLEDQTTRLHAAIHSLRSRLANVTRSEPECGAITEKREQGASPLHDLMLRRVDDVALAASEIERLEILLTV